MVPVYRVREDRLAGERLRNCQERQLKPEDAEAQSNHQTVGEGEKGPVFRRI